VVSQGQEEGGEITRAIEIMYFWALVIVSGFEIGCMCPGGIYWSWACLHLMLM
jgi:hypothetical protein